MKDFFKTILSIIVLIGIVIVLLLAGVATKNKLYPPVFIIAEYEAEAAYGPCRIIEYSIGGHVQLPAVFYGPDYSRLDEWMKELEKTGRVNREK